MTPARFASEGCFRRSAVFQIPEAIADAAIVDDPHVEAAVRRA